METITNPFQACSEVFVKPNRVFATLQEKHNWSWIPFFLILFMAILPTYLYFGFVDFDWYKEFLVQIQMADKSPAEQQSFRDNFSIEQVKIFSIIGVTVGLIVINAIVAIYLNAMAKMDDNNVNGFTDWYGFTWWTNMPIVISGLISLLMLALASDHQIPPTALSPTTLSYALSLPMNSDWYGLTSNIRLESFWSIYLTAVGVSRWTQLSNGKCWMIAIIPTALIWGIWLIVKLV
ncbi:Yip1 family protein [Neptunicella marina]|uniref:YIP1 family protein n=1 Tax=Neptunicella marina TaxID=2125989 RepID=A0A8J6LZY9_9ALTE|nr:Yip1 family protein [Neptunicella marina]MBC3764482.1 YIP1 family protein [Neptunicella marina]